MMRFARIVRLHWSLVVAFLLLATAGSLQAQLANSTGIVIGIVTDSSGAVVVGAHLSLRFNSGGAAVAAVSNASGQYSLPLVTRTSTHDSDLTSLMSSTTRSSTIRKPTIWIRLASA